MLNNLKNRSFLKDDPNYNPIQEKEMHDALRVMNKQLDISLRKNLEIRINSEMKLISTNYMFR